MHQDFIEFHIDESRVVHEQIREYVRNLIVSGKLAEGNRFPSTQELARLWNTHVPIVHQALASLTREGYLKRVNRVGTFVRKRAKKLTCVGVYEAAGVLHRSPFAQALQRALKEELTRAGIEMDMWVDSRPLAQQGEPWRPFAQAAANREFQALIAMETDWPHIHWQSKLPVPVSFWTANPDVPNSVGLDMPQFAELSLRALARQGCRSVGLIFPGNPSSGLRPPGQRAIWSDFFDRFVNLAHDLGLAVKNDWMRLWPHADDVASPPPGRFGYEEFRRLWSQPQRPDGLVVYPDSEAQGAIVALLEKQVRVPADLKLVLHKNESVDLLCPVPVTFVASREREIARALIEQVQKQFRGETCAYRRLPFRLLAPPAAEQTRGGARRGSSR